MNDIYESCRKEAKRREQENIKRGLINKATIKGCDDFHCCFAGTELCIPENCDECKLRNCRGCKHLEECFDEMMEV